MDARVLAQVLRALPAIEDPDVLVGLRTSDDAGVYRLNDELALVQSVDFFTPIVDDARTFGRIAAANALSDIYAMGAQPVSAIALAAFPETGLDTAILTEILAGGVEKAREAGIEVIGGHTIKDDVPKYGLCVSGVVHPQRILRNSGGRALDALILTKPLGTGVLTTARRRDMISDGDLRTAIASMERLNACASRIALRFGAHAATDVTGFGLLGHLRELNEASRTGAVIRSADVPLFAQTLGLVRRGCAPGGTHDNRSAAAAAGTRFDPAITGDLALALCDAQTSGGLLIAVEPDTGDDVVSALRHDGDVQAQIIGSLTSAAGITLV